jgi:hypothetical protein
MPDRSRVFLACPSYGPVEPEMAMGIAGAARRREVTARNTRVSLLALNCNLLWCEALNRRGTAQHPDHFAMLHADIGPETGWLDKLLDERERVGADVLSAIVPIKDDRGQTSTAVETEADVRRLSVSELDGLPPTFDVSALGPPGSILLANTGLFVCDFSQPWVEQVWFEIIDTIERNAEGIFEPLNLPEDWNFSRKCAALGVKVFVTQIIKLDHFGRQAWSMPGQ